MALATVVQRDSICSDDLYKFGPNILLGLNDRERVEVKQKKKSNFSFCSSLFFDRWKKKVHTIYVNDATAACCILALIELYVRTDRGYLSLSTIFPFRLYRVVAVLVNDLLSYSLIVPFYIETVSDMICSGSCRSRVCPSS